MEDLVLVSVIMPTYNRARVIERSISSVLKQTYKNLELIIVDDGSTDNTESIVNNIMDSRIHYVKSRHNLGACHARNLGINLAKGEYIAFQDSDDVWHLDKIEKQLHLIQKTKADLVTCRYNRYIEGSKKSKITIPDNVNEGFCLVGDIIGRPLFGTSCIFAKTKVFKTNKFDEGLPRFQDFEVILRIIQDYSVYLALEALVDAFVQNDSITKNYNKLVQAEEIILQKHGNLIEYYPAGKSLHLKRLILGKAISGIPCSRECSELVMLDNNLKNRTIYALNKIHLLKLYYKISYKISNVF